MTRKIREYLRRDGWLAAALVLVVALCLLLGSSESGNAGQTSDEARISQVLSAMAGAGRVDVAIYYDNAVPCGAVVVADGAGDAAVRIRLSGAVTTLLGLDVSRVAVYEREGER